MKCGLKADAKVFDELVLDVNTVYFEENGARSHGGSYEFAKQFYEAAYQLPVAEAGGEEYILSAVMHTDEKNAALSAAAWLGCGQIISNRGTWNVRWHDLRHTFASMLVNKKEPIFAISKLLGHKSIKTTERYLHLSPEEARNAISSLDGAFPSQFFEEEVEKYRRIRESKKALKLATLAELKKRDRASEEEVASIAREYGIDKTLKFLKRLSKHADGYFTLQTMHRRFYSGTEVWGMPERVSAADFITHYPEMKEKNMLGYEYKLSLVGTPSLFCLDGVDKAHLARMRVDGMAPFAVLELSPGSYQTWIELKSDDKNISYGAWRSINDYLANKYDAQKRSGHNTPSCAFPGFLSYSGGSKGILVALDLPEETLGKPKKTVADLMAEMSKSINKAPSTDIRTADTTYIPESGGVDGIPGWFIEKWYEDRSDLINSKKCPKRNDGTPDDSLIDFIIAKNLISYYKNHRHEVLRERVGCCYELLVKEADDPHRFHRKKDPCGYAKRTVNAVLRNLGLENLVFEEIQIDFKR